MRYKSLFSFDIILFSAVLLLVIIGVLFIFSSGYASSGVTSTEYVRQIIWFVIGVACLVLLYFFDYRRLRMISPYIYAAFILLLLITLLTGKIVNGAKSWIGFGPVGFQPSEFAKLATILFLATYFIFTGDKIKQLRYFLLGLGIVLLPALLILLQPDMGTAMVYLPVFFLMSFLAGAKLRHILFIILVGATAVIIGMLPEYEKHIQGSSSLLFSTFFNSSNMVFITIIFLVSFILSATGFFISKIPRLKSFFYWMMYSFAVLVSSLPVAILIQSEKFLREYQKLRLIVFLKPGIYEEGAGWNLIRALTAVGSGGWFGSGFLKGAQSHSKFIPQQSTDFIISIIGEEIGFLGCLLIIVLYMVIFVRGLSISLNASDGFGAYIAVGIVAYLFFHVMINMGMAIGVMPITGIPLVFVSYGGSALLTGLIAIGFLINIHQRST